MTTYSVANAPRSVAIQVVAPKEPGAYELSLDELREFMQEIGIKAITVDPRTDVIHEEYYEDLAPALLKAFYARNTDKWGTYGQTQTLVLDADTAPKTMPDVIAAIKTAMRQSGHRSQFRRLKPEYMYEGCGAQFYVMRGHQMTVIELAGTVEAPTLEVTYS